jgi:hypothetical protein
MPSRLASVPRPEATGGCWEAAMVAIISSKEAIPAKSIEVLECDRFG